MMETDSHDEELLQFHTQYGQQTTQLQDRLLSADCAPIPAITRRGLLERRPIDLGGGYPEATLIPHQLFCITANVTFSAMITTAAFQEPRNSEGELNAMQANRAKGAELL
jgi:hypothetical protein